MAIVKNLKDSYLKDLSYEIINTSNICDSVQFDLFEKAYDFWKETWREILIAIGSPEVFSPDDFYRQNYIPLILYKNEIIAAHCSTVFDLRSPCVKDLKYFSILNQKSRGWVFNSGFKTMMSIEYLTVAKNWRKKKLGFSLAEVLISTGARIIEEKRIDASMGITIKSTGVGPMSSKVGWNVVGNNIKRGEFSCDLMGFKAGTQISHPCPVTEEAINYLWESRSQNKDLFGKGEAA